MHGSNPLAYDHALATKAQEYAQYLNDNGITELTPSDPLSRPDEGENTMWSTALDLATSAAATTGFYDEVLEYNYTEPNLSTGAVDRFTQLVWNGSCSIGCGIAGQYVVCRYSPQGN